MIKERRLVGVDLGIASDHTVRVLTGDGSEVCRRRARPTVESLAAREAAALAEAPAGTRLEVVMEPTGPAWLPVAVFFTARGHRVFRVASAKAADLRRFLSRHAKSNGIDADTLARLPLLAPECLQPLELPGPEAAALDRRVRACDRLTQQGALHQRRIKDLVRQLFPDSPLTGDLSRTDLAVLERWADPRELLAAGPSRLLAVITKTAIISRPGRFPTGKQFRSFTGLAPKASETGNTDRKGEPMSKAGNRLLRTTLIRVADNARRQDPQLAQIYYVQMVERGADTSRPVAWSPHTQPNGSTQSSCAACPTSCATPTAPRSTRPRPRRSSPGSGPFRPRHVPAGAVARPHRTAGWGRPLSKSTRDMTGQTPEGSTNEATFPATPAWSPREGRSRQPLDREAAIGNQSSTWVAVGRWARRKARLCCISLICSAMHTLTVTAVLVLKGPSSRSIFASRYRRVL